MSTEAEGREITPTERLMARVAAEVRAGALRRIETERQHPEDSAFAALVYYMAARRVLAEVYCAGLPPGGMWDLMPESIRGSVDYVADQIRGTCRNKLNN